MAKKKKPAKKPTFKPHANVWLEGDNEDEATWRLRYEVIQGKPQEMMLECFTRDEAIFEASQLSGIPERAVTVG